MDVRRFLAHPEMKGIRIAILAAAALPVASCVTRLDDEQLTPAPRPPAALTYFGGQKPHLRTWADFHFYTHASLELEDIDRRWAGDGAIPGRDTAVTLDEGSVIEHTTAHPQYYQIQLLLPARLEVGQVIPLRTVASRRTVTRRDISWGNYSQAAVGELAVGGMTGYDIPVVQPRHSVRVGTATVESLSPTTMTLKLAATIPLRLAYQRPETHYRLQVHRTYVLKRKRPGGA
jgi:hypothetical protein